MDVSAPSTSPELSVAKLQKFFERHFAVLELRILVMQTLGEGLQAALPCDGVSSVAMAVEAASLFGRHGAIDADLFDTLLQQRPRLSHEIDKLRHECLPAARASNCQVAALSPEEWDFQGRDDEISVLRHILLEQPPGAAAVLGPAGIGKSAFTLHVLHDPAVRDYYGTRRWFVRLDAAPSTEAAVQLVAVALGLRHDEGDAITAVCLALGRQPGVLVLDNLETPWELDRARMEAMLRCLCAVDGLAVVASVRGTVSPGGLPRPKIFRMVPLARKQTSALFLSIAPEHEGDPRLARLLEPLGGVPLAVVLLARVSLGNDLGNVEQDWAQRRTEMLLELGPDHDRLTSWAVSLELSWQGRRMNAALTANMP